MKDVQQPARYQIDEDALCSGTGQADTRALVKADGTKNRRKLAGQPYDGITWPEIVAMALETPKDAKATARWMIASTYRDHDARTFSVQAERGWFALLRIDFDDRKDAVGHPIAPAPSMAEVLAALDGIFGTEVERLYYSSSSTKSANGYTCGDSFDLYVHHGDFDAAVRAAAEDLGVAHGDNLYGRLERKRGRCQSRT